MILLWGVPSEPPLHMALEAADRLGIDHLVVNQRAAADDDVVVDIGTREGVLWTGGREVSLSTVEGVYVRIMEPARLPELRNGQPDRRERGEALHDVLLGWVDQAPCRVANRTAAMASNASKPYQAQLISECGFEVPLTLVTNDIDEVLRFERRHGPLVYKSTSSVRSVVSAFDDEARRRLALLRSLPVQFQRREQGDDVRVHVVGERLLAVRAATTALDYRYASRDGHEVTLEPIDLDDDLAVRCRTLSRSLGLPFCGIDLMLRPDGSYVCFEVNPSPGYSWYEEQTGLPISEALVSWLAAGRA